MVTTLKLSLPSENPIIAPSETGIKLGFEISLEENDV
jgi:hypothetical protein